MSWFWWVAVWFFGALSAWAGYRVGLFVGRERGFYDSIKLAEQTEDVE